VVKERRSLETQETYRKGKKQQNFPSEFLDARISTEQRKHSVGAPAARRALAGIRWDKFLLQLRGKINRSYRGTKNLPLIEQEQGRWGRGKRRRSPCSARHVLFLGE